MDTNHAGDERSQASSKNTRSVDQWRYCGAHSHLDITPLLFSLLLATFPHCIHLTMVHEHVLKLYSSKLLTWRNYVYISYIHFGFSHQLALFGKPKMKLALVFLAVFIAALAAANASDLPKPRALAVVDSLQTRSTHSRFFNYVNSIYDLDLKEASDADLELSKHGEYLYDALIHMAPSATGIFTRLLWPRKLLSILIIATQCQNLD